MLLIVGSLLHQAERDGTGIPAFVVWAFVPLTVVAVIVMPISGIWLLIPPAAGMVLYRRRRIPNVPPGNRGARW
jgi:hypothetical protein